MKPAGAVVVKGAAAMLFFMLFCKSLLFMTLLPPWLGNDEPNHFEYLYKFADADANHQKEILSSMNRNSFWELTEMKPPAESVETFASTDLINHSEQITGTRPSVYYVLAALPLRLFSGYSVEVKLASARFVSVIFSMATLYLIYLSGQLIFAEAGGGLRSIILTGIAGFHPQFSYLGSVVNSDSLLALIFTLFFYILLLHARRGAIEWQGILLLCGTILLAVMVKKHGFLLLPILLLSIPFICKEGKLLLYGRLLLLLVAGLLLCEAFLPGELLKLLDRLALAYDFATNDTYSSGALSLIGWVKGLAIMFVTFWFVYGQMIYKLSFGLYILLGLLSLVAIFGMAKQVAKWRSSGDALKAVLPVSIIIFGLLVFATISTFFSPELMERASGRYLFYGIAPFSYLLMSGIHHAGGFASRYLGGLNLLYLFIALNLISIFGYLLPLYNG